MCQDDLLWTFFSTFAAARTFRLVNMCNVVLNGNCFRFTLFCTKTTADTAHFTNCHHFWSFILIRTGYHFRSIVWNQFDQMIWTFLSTFATSNALFFIHNRNAMLDMNRIEATRCNTRTKSHTAVCTCFIAATWNCCCTSAVRNSIIVCFDTCLITSTCTLYKRNFLYVFTGRYTGLFQCHGDGRRGD